jgi:hypothetical protein
MLKNKLNYWRRIFKVYLTNTKSYLNFWHEVPAVSDDINPNKLGKYYMTFENKAEYDGPRDKDGAILFNYHSDIGIQYNPIAIAQYGLGHINIYLENDNEKNLIEAKKQADWLVKNLEENEKGVFVWKHNFYWNYVERLKPGWYGALSQGAGISLLVRVYKETEDEKYLETAKKAFDSFKKEIKDGGVTFTDDEGNIWLEEYIVNPPSHILNGFIWALWGVWDYYLLTKDEEAKEIFNNGIKTIKENLYKFDIGYWSLYDLTNQKMKMIASPFYHKLHIAQLEATYKITGDNFFKIYEEKFKSYQNSWFKRKRAFIYKSIFKLFYF